VLWLDASDATTISATTNLVDQWRDKSGNANHASGAGGTRFTTNAATQNGLNVMTVANGNGMTLTSGIAPADVTIITVSKVVGGGASGQTLLANAGTTPPIFGFIGSQMTWDGLLFFANNGSVCNIYGCTRNAANNEALYAGSSTTASASGSFASNANNFNLLGQYGALAAYNFAGQYAEVIVYSRVLSAGELGQVFTYLKAKWGTP